MRRYINIIENAPHVYDGSFPDPGPAPEPADPDSVYVWGQDENGDYTPPESQDISEDEEPPKRRGRPRLDNPKAQLTVRLDHAVVEALRASGPGWMTRMNAILRQGLGLD